MTEVNQYVSGISESDGKFNISGLDPSESLRLYFHFNNFIDTVITYDLVLGLSDSLDVGEIILVYAKTLLSGRVLDTDKKPVKNVGIVVEQQGISSLSFKEGMFVLPPVDPGLITLMFATNEGSGTFSLETLPDKEYDNIELIVDQSGGEFIGRVVGQMASAKKGTEHHKLGANSTDNAAPVEGAGVSAIAGILNAVTDENGFFHLKGIPSGVNILLKIVIDDDSMFVHSTKVSEGGVTNLSNLLFKPSITKNGITLIPVETRVIDTSSHMILTVSAFTTSNVEISGYLWDTDSDGDADTTTAKGTLVLPTREVGSYKVGVTAFDRDTSLSAKVEIDISVISQPRSDATLSGISFATEDIDIDFDPETTFY
ncbi:MAG: hypothetical protein HRT71_08080, partial [Flavobacteriales bacterium]|nr:hypothetical protein [Flavobacteriales bacterium]